MSKQIAKDSQEAVLIKSHNWKKLIELCIDKQVDGENIEYWLIIQYFCHLIQGEGDEARVLSSRADYACPKSPYLEQLKMITLAFNNRDFSTYFSLFGNLPKNDSFAELAIIAQQSVRERNAALLEMNCATISLAVTSEYCGLPSEEVFKYVKARGWTYDYSTKFFTIPREIQTQARLQSTKSTIDESAFMSALTSILASSK
ncbi:uncharacterized protein MONOS_18684 [Monocercomonoides exilis]|uniref:uncharacterized protein n=1 Tax=Monocercomonoides exilis TaxID=2049356 RepID=UPI00355A9B36|nr:hypothetical protein MONOS_18684 [Monocercomonoides exilis]